MVHGRLFVRFSKQAATAGQRDLLSLEVECAVENASVKRNREIMRSTRLLILVYFTVEDSGRKGEEEERKDWRGV